MLDCEPLEVVTGSVASVQFPSQTARAPKKPEPETYWYSLPGSVAFCSARRLRHAVSACYRQKGAWGQVHPWLVGRRYCVPTVELQHRLDLGLVSFRGAVKTNWSEKSFAPNSALAYLSLNYVRWRKDWAKDRATWAVSIRDAAISLRANVVTSKKVISWLINFPDT